MTTHLGSGDRYIENTRTYGYLNKDNPIFPHYTVSVLCRDVLFHIVSSSSCHGAVFKLEVTEENPTTLQDKTRLCYRGDKMWLLPNYNSG